jgi:hypothetical protein
MREYRIFILDHTGKVLGPSSIAKFASDDEAILEIRKSLNGATVELWDGPRRVATLRSTDDVPRV